MSKATATTEIARDSQGEQVKMGDRAVVIEGADELNGSIGYVHSVQFDCGACLGDLPCALMYPTPLGSDVSDPDWAMRISTRWITVIGPAKGR